MHEEKRVFLRGKRSFRRKGAWKDFSKTRPACLGKGGEKTSGVKAMLGEKGAGGDKGAPRSERGREDDCSCSGGGLISCPEGGKGESQKRVLKKKRSPPQHRRKKKRKSLKKRKRNRKKTEKKSRSPLSKKKRREENVGAKSCRGGKRTVAAAHVKKGVKTERKTNEGGKETLWKKSPMGASPRVHYSHAQLEKGCSRKGRAWELEENQERETNGSNLKNEHAQGVKKRPDELDHSHSGKKGQK